MVEQRAIGSLQSTMSIDEQGMRRMNDLLEQREGRELNAEEARELQELVGLWQKANLAALKADVAEPVQPGREHSTDTISRR